MRCFHEIGSPFSLQQLVLLFLVAVYNRSQASADLAFKQLYVFYYRGNKPYFRYGQHPQYCSKEALMTMLALIRYLSLFESGWDTEKRMSVFLNELSARYVATSIHDEYAMRLIVAWIALKKKMQPQESVSQGALTTMCRLERACFSYQDQMIVESMTAYMVIAPPISSPKQVVAFYNLLSWQYSIPQEIYDKPFVKDNLREWKGRPNRYELLHNALLQRFFPGNARTEETVNFFRKFLKKYFSKEYSKGYHLYSRLHNKFINSLVSKPLFLIPKTILETPLPLLFITVLLDFLEDPKRYLETLLLNSKLLGNQLSRMNDHPEFYRIAQEYKVAPSEVVKTIQNGTCDTTLFIQLSQALIPIVLLDTLAWQRTNLHIVFSGVLACLVDYCCLPNSVFYRFDLSLNHTMLDAEYRILNGTPFPCQLLEENKMMYTFIVECLGIGYLEDEPLCRNSTCVSNEPELREALTESALSDGHSEEDIADESDSTQRMLTILRQPNPCEQKNLETQPRLLCPASGVPVNTGSLSLAPTTSSPAAFMHREREQEVGREPLSPQDTQTQFTMFTPQ